MTCKECCHYDVCQAMWENLGMSKVYPSQCAFFKDKSTVLELPCKIGDTVYRILGEADGHWEESRYILDSEICYKIYKIKFSLIFLNDIGKTVFLTREEAEAALIGGDGNG